RSQLRPDGDAVAGAVEHHVRHVEVRAVERGLAVGDEQATRPAVRVRGGYGEDLPADSRRPALRGPAFERRGEAGRVGRRAGGIRDLVDAEVVDVIPRGRSRGFDVQEE